jgi:anhydro-N-acetylmuramic acid kinase
VWRTLDFDREFSLKSLLADCPTLVTWRTPAISGTSMDGIDAALVRISGPATQPRVRLIAFETLPYPRRVREWLLEIAGGSDTTAEEIDHHNTVLGAAFGEAAARVCKKGHVNSAKLFAVGSHGQTIHHYGGSGLKVTQEFLAAARKLLAKAMASERRKGRLSRGGERNFAINLSYYPEVLKTLEEGTPVKPELWSDPKPCTLQIAEPALIAERMGVPVVADFRPADMAACGQGAPLVPMLDYLLLRDARKGTVALNIGGIANFTVIPAGAEPEEVFGFDTGPGNMLIDSLVRRFTHGKKTYDASGRWAARGQVIAPLLERMLRYPFFQRQPPKSAGREQFGDAFLERFLREERDSRPEDLLRTATELTARTIANALQRFMPRKIAIHRLIISGGGAHNQLLVTRLTELLPKLSLHRSDEFGLDVDAKEAIAFAVLADRTMHGLPGNLPSVTGARRPVVLGKISRP